MKAKPLIYVCLWMWTISIFANQSIAQEIDSTRIKPAEDQPYVKNKVQKAKMFFNRDLKIGIDFSTLISGAITPIRRGVDLSADFTYKPRLFVVLEGGYNYFEKENQRIKYISKGNYIRVGVDYNLRKSVEENDRDIYYVGFRYGFSQFEQEVPTYLLLNGYWGNSMSSLGSESGYAHWMEVVTGFKVEVIKNWYLGMGMRIKFFIHRSKTVIEPVQYVPGYAKNYNSGVLDFNYTLYYNIPLNYKKKKIAVYHEGN